jgi:hypothetical protein
VSTFTEEEEIAEPPRPDETLSTAWAVESANSEKRYDPQACPEARHIRKHCIGMEKLFGQNRDGHNNGYKASEYSDPINHKSSVSLPFLWVFVHVQKSIPSQALVP